MEECALRLRTRPLIHHTVVRLHVRLFRLVFFFIFVSYLYAHFMANRKFIRIVNLWAVFQCNQLSM